MTSLPAILGGTPVAATRIDFARPVLPAASAIADELAAILESRMVTNGPFTRAFETDLAEYLNVKHAIAVANATSGLMMAYRSLDLRGEVVVPSFTFMATISALVWAGAKPVFAEVDFATGNLDPSAAAAAITSETCAVVATHNSGNPADIAELESIAARHKVPLIFDAAHAFGSRWKNEPVGAQGDVQIFSLTPTKLVVAGEGGVITTNDDRLAERLRTAREYGHPGNYDSEFAGLNGRMSELSALLGQHSLRHLEPAVTRRNEIAAYYRQRLGQLPGIAFQFVRSGNRCSFKDFSIIIDATVFGLTRDELALVLAAENIDTRKYYDPPAHRQKAYRDYAPANGSLRTTEFLSAAILNLPIWSQMGESTASDVCLAIERAFASRDEVRAKLRLLAVKGQSASAS